MTSSMLIPALVQLKREFDQVFPGRGRAADGDIGDATHQKETSDHNDDEVGRVPIHDADHIHEVHALDVDNALDGAGPVDGDPARMALMEAVVQHILARCRSGAERRLRYTIYDHRIWEASNSWRERPYDGASPHTEHAHFSGSYDTPLEASTASWHLGEIMLLTPADLAAIGTLIDQRLDALTAPAAFAKGGGEHTEVGDAVLRSSYPARQGEDRNLVWANLQLLQKTADAVLKAVTAPPQA